MKWVADEPVTLPAWLVIGCADHLRRASRLLIVMWSLLAVANMGAAIFGHSGALKVLSAVLAGVCAYSAWGGWLVMGEAVRLRDAAALAAEASTRKDDA